MYAINSFLIVLRNLLLYLMLLIHQVLCLFLLSFQGCDLLDFDRNFGRNVLLETDPSS